MSPPPTGRAKAVSAFLNRTPFAQTLGLRADIHGDSMTAVLPYKDALIGNAAIQALHGGAIGAFLELTAQAQLYLEGSMSRVPKPINLTIEYLRKAGPHDLHARAEVARQGRNLAFVKAETWQRDRDRPVAALIAHFLIVPEGGDAAASGAAG